MILFALEKYEAMGAAFEKNLPWLKSGRSRVARYDNGELHISLPTPVKAQHCLILGSVAPPDEQLLSVLLLAHTLKKEGAASVTALLPYLAYSRQDKDKPGESLATAWAGLLARASGLDQVITVDLHSKADQQLFAVPLLSLSSAEIFASAINEYQLQKATIVAPDNGAIGRCEEVKLAAGMPKSETPYFEKHRVETGITHVGPIGKVGSQAVIIDDVLDTGITLVSACEKLAGAGVQEIHIMVTHGLFTGTSWKELWSLGVKRIFCTDSVPLPADFDANRIVRLSVIPLVQRYLLSVRRDAQLPEKGQTASAHNS
jgi:ribose-phosphate pyrophosphokinase